MPSLTMTSKFSYTLSVFVDLRLISTLCFSNGLSVKWWRSSRI